MCFKSFLFQLRYLVKNFQILSSLFFGNACSFTYARQTSLEGSYYIIPEHLFDKIKQNVLLSYFSGKDKKSILACKSLCEHERCYFGS